MQRFERQGTERPAQTRKRAEQWCREHPGEVAEVVYPNGVVQHFRYEDRAIHPDHGNVKRIPSVHVQPDGTFDGSHFNEARFVSWVKMSDAEGLALCNDRPSVYREKVAGAKGPAAKRHRDALVAAGVPADSIALKRPWTREETAARRERKRQERANRLSKLAKAKGAAQ